VSRKGYKLRAEGGRKGSVTGPKEGKKNRHRETQLQEVQTHRSKFLDLSSFFHASEAAEAKIELFEQVDHE